MTEENARQGRRNKQKGDWWRDAVVRWFNERGWPGAGYQLRKNSSDITGTWDLAIETTDTTWGKMWEKLGQAGQDAGRRGLPYYCVFKKRYGSTDPGKGDVIMRACVFFPMVWRLEELERREMDAEREFERGFRLGQKDAEREAV